MQPLFQKWVIDGGIMMVALVPCLILTIAFIIQAIVSLRRDRLAPEDFADRLREARATGGAAGAREVLESEQHSLAEIVRHADAHLEFNPNADAAAILREEIEAEVDMLLQQHSQFPVIYRIAPQLGLLGTVLGLFNAFGAYGSANELDIKALSAGINEALVATIWGLVIAIPAYLAYYLIQRHIANYEKSVFPRMADEALQALRGTTGAGG